MQLIKTELSEYCRKKGLFPKQVKQWRENCVQAKSNIPGQIVEFMQQYKALQKELRLVLQRK